MNDNWVKANVEQIADQISETIGYLHKQIFYIIDWRHFEGEEATKIYWDNDYIIGFYSKLILCFSQKITKNITTVVNAAILEKVMSHLTPKNYPDFIKKFSIISLEKDNKNMILGVNHATDLFCTFEGLPIEPEFINRSHLTKARKISSKYIYNKVSAELGSSENQRVAMALIEVYAKDYIEKFIFESEFDQFDQKDIDKINELISGLNIKDKISITVWPKDISDVYFNVNIIGKIKILVLKNLLSNEIKNNPKLGWNNLKNLDETDIGFTIGKHIYNSSIYYYANFKYFFDDEKKPMQSNFGLIAGNNISELFINIYTVLILKKMLSDDVIEAIINIPNEIR